MLKHFYSSSSTDKIAWGCSRHVPDSFEINVSENDKTLAPAQKNNNGIREPFAYFVTLKRIRIVALPKFMGNLCAMCRARLFAHTHAFVCMNKHTDG